MCTWRVVTANSRAALHSDGPFCPPTEGEKKIDEGNNNQKHSEAIIYAYTFIIGTRLAMLRIIKTSPGWNPNMLEGHTLESAQAITINCTWIYQF